MIKMKYFYFLTILFSNQCFSLTNATINDSKIVHNLCVQSISNIGAINDKDQLDKICYNADNFKNSYIDNVKKMYQSQNKEISKEEMIKYNHINSLFLLKNEYDANKKNNIDLKVILGNSDYINKYINKYIYLEYE